MTDILDPLVAAAEHADWMQVVLNQGPPCFHIEEDGHFCLRAERWAGHGTVEYNVHRFLSLAELLTALLQRHAVLRAALVGFTGSDDPTELDAIEAVIRQSGAPLSDMAVAINGIDALRQTRRAEGSP